MTTEDEQIRTLLVQAMDEPSPSRKLVRQTVCRCRAVALGRKAAERLKGRPSSAQRSALLAACIVGRLARDVPLPDGVTAETAAAEVQKNAAFQGLLADPDDLLLGQLNSGELLRRLSRQPAKAAGQKPPVLRGPGRAL